MKREDKLTKERYLKKLEHIRSGAVVNAFETPQEKTDRIERAKRDPIYMVEYYFPHYATSKSADFHKDFALKVAKNKTFKGFAEWGRGLAKSVWVDILIPYWLWMRGEPVYLVIIGDSYDKAKALLADIQGEFEVNPRIIADFGEQKLMGSWEDGDFTTTSGFIGKALGMGQNVRGLRKQSLRPTYCVVDDAETKAINKNPKRQKESVKWIEQDLIPTMDGDYRRFIQANNRFAPVMIQTKLQDKHPKWVVHHIKAFNKVTYEPRWKEKYPANYYRELVDELGLLAVLAEYNHEPHIEGEIFTDKQIQWAKLPKLNHFKIIVAHWDVAYAGTPNSDYNAVRIWGLKGKDFFYIDSFVKQSKMRSAIEYMAAVQMSLPDTVIIHWQYESQFWNDALEQEIKAVEDKHNIKLNLIQVDSAKGNKYDRILTLQPYYQQGRIYYNIEKKSHNDTAVGLAQLKGIEPGYNTHDDAPDADHGAISRLSKHITVSRGKKPLVGKRKRKYNH